MFKKLLAVLVFGMMAHAMLTSYVSKFSIHEILIPAKEQATLLRPFLKPLNGPIRFRLFGSNESRRTRASRAVLEAIKPWHEIEIQEKNPLAHPGFQIEPIAQGSLAMEHSGKRVIVKDASLRSIASGLRSLKSHRNRRILFLSDQNLRPGAPKGFSRAGIRLAESLQADIFTGPTHSGVSMIILGSFSPKLSPQQALEFEEFVHLGGTLFLWKETLGSLKKPIELLGMKREKGYLIDANPPGQRSPAQIRIEFSSHLRNQFSSIDFRRIFVAPNIGLLRVESPSKILASPIESNLVDLGFDPDSFGQTQEIEYQAAAVSWVNLGQGKIAWLPSLSAFADPNLAYGKNRLFFEALASLIYDGTPPLPQSDFIPNGVPDLLERPRLDRAKAYLLIAIIPLFLLALGLLLSGTFFTKRSETTA